VLVGTNRSRNRAAREIASQARRGGSTTLPDPNRISSALQREDRSLQRPKSFAILNARIMSMKLLIAQAGCRGRAPLHQTWRGAAPLSIGGNRTCASARAYDVEDHSGAIRIRARKYQGQVATGRRRHSAAEACSSSARNATKAGASTNSVCAGAIRTTRRSGHSSYSCRRRRDLMRIFGRTSGPRCSSDGSQEMQATFTPGFNKPEKAQEDGRGPQSSHRRRICSSSTRDERHSHVIFESGSMLG